MVKRATQNIKGQVSKKFRFFALMKGVIYAYIIAIPFFIAFALILTYTDFPEKYIAPAVIITTIGSILFASLTSAKSIKTRAWLNGSLVGFFYMLILYFISSIVFKNFSLDKYVLTMVLIGVLSGAIGGILGVSFGKKIRPRKWKRK